MKAVSLAAFCVIACTPPSSRVAPQPCPPGGISSSTLLATTEQPKPVELFIPPLPMPNDVRGSRASIRVVVDTLGRVVSDSVIVCGIANPTYSRRVAEAAAALQFQPRRAAGRPVIAPSLLVYDF